VRVVAGEQRSDEGDVRHDDQSGESGRRPTVAIYHPTRAAPLARALAAAGYRAAPLPAPTGGLASWLDCCFDLLAVNPFGATPFGVVPFGPAPFGGGQEAGELVRLARTIAGRRPLLVLSDRESADDRMAALRAGADDAVGWTDGLAEILARIGGLLRRSRVAAGQLGEGELHIDLIDRRVERAGRLIRLPLREFDLLANLARVPDRPVSRAALLKAVWRIDFDPGTNRVEVHMSRLRAKVDRGFAWPMLRTVKGRGYMLSSRPDRGLDLPPPFQICSAI